MHRLVQVSGGIRVHPETVVLLQGNTSVTLGNVDRSFRRHPWPPRTANAHGAAGDTGERTSPRALSRKVGRTAEKSTIFAGGTGAAPGSADVSGRADPL
ncbi:hypothetical protein GCM10027440_37970 [Nocardiopsis coralliicola]